MAACLEPGHQKKYYNNRQPLLPTDDLFPNFAIESRRTRKPLRQEKRLGFLAAIRHIPSPAYILGGLCRCN